MVFERPRGVRDFDPDEMQKRDGVRCSIESVLSSYGYRMIGTPAFEFSELFEEKSGQGILDHLYVFEDKGGRRLCLRPEATASVARMYSSDLRSRPKPLRLSYWGPMYRYEQPQRGRYREFWQAGVELIGAEGPYADAETIACASSCLKALDLDYRLRISHMGIIRKLLEMQGVEGKDQDSVIQLIDKGDFEKVKEKAGQGPLTELLDSRGSENSLDIAARLLKDEDKHLAKELGKVLALLDVAGFPYELDFGMARGLDYYTGIVFDAKIDCLGAQDQVAGGGRYDNLISVFGGPETPAVGFALGVDRLMEALKEKDSLPEVKGPDVYVIPVSDEVADHAFKISCELRVSCPMLRVEQEVSARKMGKALQHASSMGCRYTLIVGPKELEEECVTVKDMTSQKQEKVRISELAGYLS